MAYIGLRLHEVEGWGGESEALPPGEDYAFLIESKEQKPSSRKGTNMLELSCKVLEPESLAGRKIRHSFVAAPDAKDGSRKRLRNIADATLIGLDDQGGFDDDELVGRMFRGDVINEANESEDLVTGAKVVKNYARIQNERPYEQLDAAGYPGDPGQAWQAEPEPAPQPEPAPRQAPPRAPVAPPRAAAPAQRPAAPPPRNGQGAVAPRPPVSRPAPISRV